MGGYVSVLEDIIDETPFIGHAKGVDHYTVGRDMEHGHKCMYNSTRSAATLGAGVATGGFGALAAIGAGVSVGVAYDGIASLMSGNPAGYIKNLQLFVELKDFDSAKSLLQRLLGDVLSGLFGANQTLEAVVGGTPIIGHILAMCQYFAGNTEKYRNFLVDASSSTIKMLSDAFLKCYGSTVWNQTVALLRRNVIM